MLKGISKVESVSKRINRKVMRLVIVFQILFLVVAGSYHYSKMDKDLIAKMEYITSICQTGLAGPLWTFDDAAVHAMLDKIRSDDDIIYLAAITDSNVDGHKVYQGSYASESLFEADYKNEIDIMYGDEVIGRLQIGISSESALYHLLITILSTNGFIFILLMLMGRSFSRMSEDNIFSPLRKLGYQAESISNGNLDDIVEYEREDEIGRLGKTFENMRASIKKLLSDLNDGKEELESKVQERTKELALLHEAVNSSIKYSSVIQASILPSHDLMGTFFADHFIAWVPRNTVGGDAYFLSEFNHGNDCMLIMVDCTGHGVPGAFMTMLVKAIKSFIMTEVEKGKEISPSIVLKIFNQQIRLLLKQNDPNSVCNAGFDGGVICYNKQDKIIRFSGAETPLFYIQDGEINVIKGSRHSVGYKKSDPDFEFKEHEIKASDGMQFYLTSDGFLDQNGGEKGFCFGKRKFSKLVEKYADKSMAEQNELFFKELLDYQGDSDRNDDITVVGFKI